MSYEISLAMYAFARSGILPHDDFLERLVGRAQDEDLKFRLTSQVPHALPEDVAC